MSSFDDLDGRLRPNRRNAMKKITERIAAIERLRPVLVIISIVGAFMAALSKVFNGTSGTVLAITGAVVALVGGALAALIDYRKLELGTFLTEAETIAEEAITRGRVLEAEQDRKRSDADLLDRRRLAYRQVGDIMREATEQAVLAHGVTLDKAADFMIKSAIISIGAAIGFTTDERWAISIFQVCDDGGIEKLHRLAGVRAERLGEQAQARTWCRNEGLVGVAWHTGRDGIIEDYRDPKVALDYPVPDPQRRGYDADRYRSMAAIPIRLGPEHVVWGIVAASSDQTGRFRRDPSNNRVQAVDTVRLIARNMALLAAVFALKPT